jgi:hypothetical protein
MSIINDANATMCMDHAGISLGDRQGGLYHSLERKRKESEQLSSFTTSLRIAFTYSTQPAPPTRTQLSHSTGVLVA